MPRLASHEQIADGTAHEIEPEIALTESLSQFHSEGVDFQERAGGLVGPGGAHVECEDTVCHTHSRGGPPS